VATPTIEEYLETIYKMRAEGHAVIGARVAERMGVTAPTMTDTLKRMREQGYVTTGEGREITLTAKGTAAAESMVRRHRLSERWLVDVLGMDWSQVHDEACRLEHALSPEVEARLSKALGDPIACPHGNPIPGSGQLPLEGQRLSEARPGEEVTLERVSPEAETDSQFLAYLTTHGMVPGSRLKVIEATPWAGVVTIAVGGATSVIGMDAASRLWVTRDRM
jgi:DtxR family Mn-dependent transcriptional regulator